MPEQLYTIEQRPDTEEYHIFHSKINDSGACVLNNKSICNKMDYDDDAETISQCKNENITRLEAAKKGRKVCGICVSNLYTTY